MWQCVKCRESIEDSFDTCWNCGTSKDGVEDPSFQRVEDAEPEPGDSPLAINGLTTTPIEEKAETSIQAVEGSTAVPIPVDRKCPHCGGTELVRAVTFRQPGETRGVGLVYRVGPFGSGTQTLYADLCRACGSVTRFYVHKTTRDWITG
jgi:predicted RNA-binding Zn-ribbon protein involved in translation (DUF1610 family)